MKAVPGILFAVATLLPAVLVGQTSSSDASQVFLFASPNTRDSLTDEDARGSLTSFEQVNATAVADRAACALSHSVQIANSLGVYDKTSENALIMKANLEQKRSEYLASLLGLYSHQEFVLLFLPEPGGADRLWIIKTPQSLEMAVLALRKLKLTPATVRATRDQNEIWFVDVGQKLAGILKILTSDVNGRAGITAGTAEMLGNRDRTAATMGWQERIETFERLSGRHLSSQLFTASWRDATIVHTCSREMFGRQETP